MIIGIAVVAFLVVAFYCSSLAAKKGYGSGLYFFLGVLFGPLTLLYLIGMPDSDERLQAKREALADETAKRTVAAYFDELNRREGKPPRTDWPTSEKKESAESESTGYVDNPEETYSDEDKLHYVRPISYYGNKCPNCGTEYNASRSYCQCGAQFGAIWRKEGKK